QDNNDDELTALIVQIFNDNRQSYGTRKIKVELKKKNWTVSRRRIGRIMQEQGLVSKYTVAVTCNESKTANLVNREFVQEEELKVVVSDFNLRPRSTKMALHLHPC